MQEPDKWLQKVIFQLISVSIKYSEDCVPVHLFHTPYSCTYILKYTYLYSLRYGNSLSYMHMCAEHGCYLCARAHKCIWESLNLASLLTSNHSNWVYNASACTLFLYPGIILTKYYESWSDQPANVQLLKKHTLMTVVINNMQLHVYQQKLPINEAEALLIVIIAC